MKIIPAIDLMDGVCVRLRQGEFAEATSYPGDPLSLARGYIKAGATLIHLVDLEGARSGRPVQADLLCRLASSLDAPVQVGGGIRTMETIAAYLDNGVERIVLGSVAVKEPQLMRRAVEIYGPRIVLGIDARRGVAAIQGWTESSSRDALSLAKEMAALGLREVIYTDISRDGCLSGPDLEGLAGMVGESGMAVIASGGVSSYDDLKALAATGAAGVIIGKALLDGRIELARAIALLEETG